MYCNSTQKTGQGLLRLPLLFSEHKAHKVSGQSGFVMSVGKKKNIWQEALQNG